MFGVEMDSSLPDKQSDGRDLARQSETRHRSFHSSGNAGLVEILKGLGVTAARVAAPLKMFFRSWLWLMLRSRMARTFLERFSWS